MQTVLKRPMTGHLIMCLALLGTYSCSGGNTFVTPSGPPGPSVQIIETTGDRAKLLQPQSAVRFTKGGSNSGLVVVVAVVTIAAEDTHAHRAREVGPVKIQHLTPQTRLCERTLSIVHHRVTRSRGSAKFWNDVQGVAGSDQSHWKVAIFRGIDYFAGTGSMTPQAVLVLIQRRVQRGNAIGGTDPDNAVLGGAQQWRSAEDRRLHRLVRVMTVHASGVTIVV